MKKNIVRRGLGLTLVAVMSMAAMTGCGAKEEAPEVTIADEEVAMADEPAAEVATTDAIFTKGVYANYAAEAENPDKTYFYVFDNDGTGHTDDGAANTGMFFEYEVQDGNVKFTFGSKETVEDVFTVKSVENGFVTGSFEDGLELVFEPMVGVDPDTFDAVNFVNASNGEPLVYTDANGWSVKYDPELFALNQAGPETFFVYMGESAGTNMITVTYTVDNKAEAAIQELGASYGENGLYNAGVCPGTENETGYWVTFNPDTEGSGAYMTAFARDYMDGALIFRLDGHMGEDEEMNMAVSDALASIVDSLEFPYEN